MADTFDFKSAGDTSKGLLLPAVQAASEAARDTSDPVPTETLTLNYEKIEYSYDDATGFDTLTYREDEVADDGFDGTDLLIVNNGDGSDFL